MQETQNETFTDIKIELYYKIIIIKMTPRTQPHKLIPGKKYYIYQPSTKYLPHAFYRGTFIRHHMFGTLSLFDVTALKPIEYMGELSFGRTEIYYDVEKIKENSIKAKQQMEKRALDMVLKNILNEDVVW